MDGGGGGGFPNVQENESEVNKYICDLFGFGRVRGVIVSMLRMGEILGVRN